MEFKILFYRNRPEAFKLFIHATNIQRSEYINYYHPDGWSYLLQTARDGDYEFAKMLIEHGADVNKSDNLDNSPLGVAVVNGHNNIVELLLKNGVAMDGYDGFESIMCTAISNGYRDIVKTLFSYGGSVFDTLQYAVCENDLDMTMMLVEMGADVNFTAPFLGTPLHTFLNFHLRYVNENKLPFDIDVSFKILEFLIEKGAYLNHALVDSKKSLFESLIKFCILYISHDRSLIVLAISLGRISEFTFHRTFTLSFFVELCSTYRAYGVLQLLIAYIVSRNIILEFDLLNYALIDNNYHVAMIVYKAQDSSLLPKFFIRFIHSVSLFDLSFYNLERKYYIKLIKNHNS